MPTWVGQQRAAGLSTQLLSEARAVGAAGLESRVTSNQASVAIGSKQGANNNEN